MKLILAIVVLVFASIVYAEVSPMPPTLYWGYITTDGKPVNGLRVDVYTQEGLLIATDNSLTRNDGQGRDGMYSVDVLWDDPETAAVEGIAQGNTILFKSGDRVIGKMVVGERGEQYRVDLETTVDASDEVVQAAGGSVSAYRSQTDEVAEGQPVESPEGSPQEGPTGTVIQQITAQTGTEKSNAAPRLWIPTVLVAVALLALITIFVIRRKRS
jgi:hypothetical protein